MSKGSSEKSLVVQSEKKAGEASEKAFQFPNIFPLMPPMVPNPLAIASQYAEYCADVAQRSVLLFDVLRQRSNIHIDYENTESPTVLNFKYEMILDGRKLQHPVNYHLLRILPPEGVVTDTKKRPFIVFDPRAGHGPGIGGMKEDSEIGSTLRAGHPAYFVGFLPKPIPGQTVEHVCEAEAIFIERVISLHPESEKPCLIANCQAGWQLAMVGAVNPELVGVLILAAAPMSFWNGVKGRDFLRYSGGLMGGSWPAAMASDIGNGIFDGAALVDNFEKMNPSNTHWKKIHNLYAKIDTEGPRFLEFEKWWGAPVLLNGEEIQFIVDGLFIGNRLSAARLRNAEGMRIDLRNIKSPILIFCSQGDDITPPPQALGWITDIYRSDKEIVAAGQTIIYCLHRNVGHLGIFVSSSVASKEHDKFIKNIDLIETLPPGLYEAVFSDKTDGTDYAALATGDHVLRFEARTLQDLKEIGINTPKEDRCFLASKRFSENVLSLYESYVSPWVRALSSAQSAEMLRQMHPIRVRFGMFSDRRNPLMKCIGKMAEGIRANRNPVSKDNFFWKMQEIVSDNIIATFDQYKDMRDSLHETMFFQIYGARFVQSALGLKKSDVYSKSAGRDLDRERYIQRRIQYLIDHASHGGLPEALARGLLYVVRGGGGFDEREFKMLKELCDASPTLPKISQAEFRAVLRKQHEILVLDEKHGMETISRMLDNTTDAAAQEALSAIHAIIKTHGKFTPEERLRLEKLEKYFIPSHTTPLRRKTDIQVFNY